MSTSLAESQITKTKRDGRITILDFGGANSYIISAEPGDFQFAVPDETVSVFLDRGIMGTDPDIREGDQEAMTGSFTARFRDCNQGLYATLMDILLRTKDSFVYNNWVSTKGSGHPLFTTTLVYTIIGAPFGEPDISVLFYFTVLRLNQFQEGESDNISVNWTCYQNLPTFA